jgi:hypothetical protein
MKISSPKSKEPVESKSTKEIIAGAKTSDKLIIDAPISRLSRQSSA